jgi:GTP-binding protein
MKSPFVDHVILYLTSGKGGDGVVSWRREKFVEKGGPDGGDGGKGGSIIAKGNAQMWTLLDLRYRKYIQAENGSNGQGAKRKGKSGKNEILEVPLGTVIYDADTNELLGEILEDGQELVLVEGGKGGLGNWHFRSSTNQTPDFAQKGEPAKERKVILELKVLADVGLVGFPNAGKSTLLSVLTSAKPEIADYPFTTLVPNLGIVKYKDFQSFAIADIPGIIEGAHEGKGLGIQFLRHIERNAVLLFLIPATSENPTQELKILKNELHQYNEELDFKDHLVAISKCDLVDEKTLKKLKKSFPDAVFISSVTQLNLEVLKDRLWELLHH